MNGKMKAIVKDRPGPGARLEEVDIPSIKENEVLIKVEATSVCGTDVHIYAWDAWAESRVHPPYVFGHEFAGTVVEVGSQVQHVKVGDQVSAETHIVCGTCPQCRTGKAHICQQTKIIGVDTTGCFAEYVALPAANVWKNDPALPFHIASIQEPLGNAVQTVLSGPVAGKTVAVVGCGPIGLMAVAVAKACGAAQVYALDVNDYRLQIAEKAGASALINSVKEDPVQKIMELTDHAGVDVVLEMSGHPVAIKQGFRMVTNGGRVSMLGLPTRNVELDITNDIVFKGIQVHGITGRLMYETWYQTAGLLQSGRVNVEEIITHRFPLDQFEQGFELMMNGKCLILHVD
ncbi:L-threonine 3-dehydrogenase [Caldalkalibacillus thermarum]|uniref:L-threonine 3-dehydrogenase n=1 Tax=Caldalkalibacillus thermarum TaxID=296745 RepID=UPI00166C1E95|nr:L-threonine 3-dehydrogenase [Caldalkalibacillus thermarum]GGK13125.1 L-threonine 3-dehydrogenase [Caldalkalibacillus thermarum]